MRSGGLGEGKVGQKDERALQIDVTASMAPPHFLHLSCGLIDVGQGSYWQPTKYSRTSGTRRSPDV